MSAIASMSGPGTGCSMSSTPAFGERGQVPQRGEPVPTGVEIDSDAGHTAELLGDGDDAGDVVGGFQSAHLELEAGVQPGIKLREGFFDDHWGGFGAECPGDRDRGPGAAAEQGVHRYAEAACPRVVQRDLDSGLGEEVNGDHVGQITHQRVDVVDGPPDEDRCEIAFDNQLHGFDGFSAPPWPGGNDSFAGAGDSARCAEEHVEHRLRVHAGAREAVRPAQRDVDDHRFHPVDAQIVVHALCSLLGAGVGAVARPGGSFGRAQRVRPVRGRSRRSPARGRQPGSGA